MLYEQTNALNVSETQKILFPLFWLPAELSVCIFNNLKLKLLAQFLALDEEK